MTNSLKNQIAIKLQILGSYAHIYLRLIPAFYLKQYRKMWDNKTNCIVGTIVLINAIIFLIAMFQQIIK